MKTLEPLAGFSTAADFMASRQFEEVLPVMPCSRIAGDDSVDVVPPWYSDCENIRGTDPDPDPPSRAAGAVAPGGHLGESVDGER